MDEILKNMDKSVAEVLRYCSDKYVTMTKAQLMTEKVVLEIRLWCVLHLLDKIDQ